MLNRRTVVRSALALATGSALAGTAGSASSTGSERSFAPYDAGTVADAETTVAAQIRPTALDRAPLPETVESPLSDLRSRFGSLSTSALGPARGSLALDGDRVVGAGVDIKGTFERAAVAGDLTDGSFARVRGTGSADIDVYRSETAPYAVGIDAKSIAVGYGPGDASPLAHASAVLDSGTESPSGLTTISEAVGGESRAVAALGPETRSRAVDGIPSETDGLASIVEHATAVGVGIDVADGRSSVAYGIDVDPTAISPDTYWDLITRSTDRAEGFDLAGVERDGRVLVVRGTVATDSLWSVHARLLGLD